MQKYNQYFVDKVKDADIRLFIPEVKKSKPSQLVNCPFCGQPQFSVIHKDKENTATCLACGKGFTDAVAAVMHYEGLDYDAAFTAAAAKAGIPLVSEDERREKSLSEQKKSLKKSFCALQLEASGLTVENLMANVIIDKTPTYTSPFKKGSIEVNNNFRVNLNGDDMLIYYYDLYGQPMTYTAKGSSTPRQYVRVRWSNPGIHTTADGKEIKYQTPPNASSRCYIPETIRKAFKNKSHIDTLFIQEGEKKAEKACLHGIPSIGIQGIGNFGSVREGLLSDIQEIAKVCTVDNIVLMLDSDWDDLHRNLTIGDSADKRPNSFSKAVIKFKAFIGTLHNLGLSVNIWWGHINANPGNDKGIDDLLANSLRGKEDALLADIDHAMHSHDGRGVLCNIHNISTLSDAKIQEFWHLNDPQEFYLQHKDRLSSLASFKIGRIRYKLDNDTLVPISKYSSDSDIYSIEQDSKENDKVVFNCSETMNFLRDNGFRRLRNSDDPESGYLFIRIDDGILSRVPTWEIRNFVLDYIQANCKSRLVNEFFSSKIATLLADKQLEQLALIDDDFDVFTRGVQLTPYNNGMVEITTESITPGKPFGTVWRRQILTRNFTRVPIITRLEKVGDDFVIEYSPEASKCEFLTYLCNISNNAYTHDNIRECTDEEAREWLLHLVNKITTLGYLLSDYKYASERKTVVIQDHQMSEVGRSKGGSGKSLLGTAVGKIRCQSVIDGKNIDPKFPLYNVSRETRSVFIDDVRVNYDFESIFNMANGTMSINKKNMAPIDIPVDKSPKILIATNHAINGATEDSVARRIIYMEASAWYHKGFTLFDEFQHMFFDDWDEYQWNLFDNLMAECVMYYFRSFENRWAANGGGAVPPPMAAIEQRTLRQNMSEVLLQWADEFFDPSGDNLNSRINRQELFQKFIEYAGGPNGHGVTRTSIRDKILAYCRYKGYDFNTDRPNSQGECYSDWKPKHPNETFEGTRDVSAGKEYFTVFSPAKEKTLKPF